MSVTIRVKFNKFPDVAAELPREFDLIVDKFLTDVEADATQAAPVQSGHLKSARTREKNRITWHADYAAYVNFGTRYMSAQPFVSDAVEANLPGAEQAVDDLAGRLGK